MDLHWRQTLLPDVFLSTRLCAFTRAGAPSHTRFICGINAIRDQLIRATLYISTRFKVIRNRRGNE